MSFDLVQLTDIHLLSDKCKACRGVFTYDALHDVLTDLAQHDVSHYVLSGDISGDGSVESYQNLIQLMRYWKQPFYSMMGNHDNSDSMTSVLSQWPSLPGDYCDIRQWRVIFLNSYLEGSCAGYLDKTQLNRLSELMDSWSGRVMIMLHHNCFNDGFFEKDKKIGLLNTEDFLVTIAPYRQQIKAIVSGHVHIESCHIHQDIPYYTTPAVMHRLEVESFAMPGYRWFRFHDDDIETNVVYVPSTAFVR